MRDPVPWGTKGKRKTGERGVWHWMLQRRPSSTGPAVEQLPLVYFSMRNELLLLLLLLFLLPTIRRCIDRAGHPATRHRTKPCFGILCLFHPSVSLHFPSAPFHACTANRLADIFVLSSAQLCCPRSMTAGEERASGRDGRHKRRSLDGFGKVAARQVWFNVVVHVNGLSAVPVSPTSVY